MRVDRAGEARCFPIDYANASPDVALTSLHYYFPWAITALVRWCAFCLAGGRRMHIDVDARARGSRSATDDSRTYEEKLVDYRRLADAHFQAEAYAEFCAARSPTSTSWHTSGSPATSSTGCSSTRCARRSRRTSTSSSPRTTAA